MNHKPVPKMTIAFCVLLALDFLYSLYNFLVVLGTGDMADLNVLSRIVHFTLNVLPLVALIIVSKKIPVITEKKTLTRIRTILFVYFLLDILSNFLPTSVPWILRTLFYASSMFFYIKYIFIYNQYSLIPSLVLCVGYWIAFAVLFLKLNVQIEFLQKAENGETAHTDTVDSETGTKFSPSFKIAVVSLILVVMQSAFDCVLLRALGDAIRGTVGMQAIGTAFLYFLVLALKVVYSLPLIVLAIVGIVKGAQAKNAHLRRHKCGIRINVVCLVLTAVQMAIFLLPDLWK